MCWHQWPLASTACLVVTSFCPNPSTSLYLSLHICAARLLPLRLWPAWRLRITKQARYQKKTFISPTIRGHPVAHARSCSLALRQLAFISTFELRHFPRFISLAVNFAKIFPQTLSSPCCSRARTAHSSVVHSLGRSACLYSPYPFTTEYPRAAILSRTRRTPSQYTSHTATISKCQ